MMSVGEPEHLLTVREVAERLRVHPITVRRLIKDGKLPVVRIGRAIRVREEDLGAYAQPRVAETRTSYGRQPPARERRGGQSNAAHGLPYRWPLSAREQKRLRKAFEEMQARRAKMPPLGITTTELIRQGREELEQRAERHLGLRH
jgi:excisionase family DNA binding protein